MKYWILAARPRTLIASISPICITSIYCIKYFYLNYSIFFFTLLAAMLIQILTNFINDLYDYKKGADCPDRIGPTRMIQSGRITQAEMKKAIKILFIIILSIGFYLVLNGGVLILFIGLSSFLFAYLYTATRLSIAYNGMGEIFVLFYFGIIASMGTFYLQTLSFNYQIIFIGLICGFLNLSMLVINNMRDIIVDKRSNKNTLVSIFGKTFGKIELVTANIAVYLFLYFLLLSLQKKDLFIYFSPLILLILFFIYKLVIESSFVNYKALPYFANYIFIFSIILSLILYL